VITIIADEGKNNIGMELRRGFLDEGIDADYVPLENVHVMPCHNCGQCNYESYGKCVFRDDGDWIYPKVLRSEATIMVTPITFGSYSFKAKRVLDKFGLFMDRHYYVVDRELVKGGMPGKRFKYFAIGFKENCPAEEAAAFRKLVHETLVITRGIGKGYVFGEMLTSENKNTIVKDVLRK